MTPVVRVAVRAVLAGVLVTANALIASATGSDLTGNEILLAVLGGVVSACVLAGAEVTTPINPTVGVGKDS